MNEVRILLREVPSGIDGISRVEIKLEGEDKIPANAMCLVIAGEMMAMFAGQLQPLDGMPEPPAGLH